jgi:predicted nucleic acid-binding OB-fold protein
LQEATAKQRLENEVKELKSQLAKKTEPLDVFNNLSASQVAFRLKSTGITETTAIKIAESVEVERSKNQFESLNDVVNRVKLKSGKRLIKGISSEKMLNIVDSWSKISFN